MDNNIININDVAIQAKKLNIYYGSNHAIKDLNIRVKKKDITALIGPSGCGKSTFLRAINGMNHLVPSCRMDGEIIFDDVNINKKDIDWAQIRKKIGMVWQKPNPFQKSIYENIAYALKYYGIKDKRTIDGVVEESLKKVGLWDEVKDRLKKSALALSGGQQQRLCIARAISIDPEILLLDEPTSALDPISSYIIEEMLDELVKEYTIIIVTHNMQQAGRISNYTAFFYTGELIEYNSTTSLFSNPSNKITEDYLAGRFG